MCWGHARHEVLNPIRVMQNKIVKSMLFQPIDSRIRPLLASLNLLNVNDIFKVEVAKHVHKFICNTLPDVFNEQYDLISTTRTIRTRAAGRSNIVVNRTNKHIGKQTSTVLGASIWNEIPDNIRTLSFINFKDSLKSYLLQSYS